MSEVGEGPQTLSLKNKLRRIGLATVATVGLTLGGKALVEKAMEDPGYYGEPYGDNSLVITDIQLIRDNLGKNIPPTYRSKPEIGGHEYTEEELLKLGFNPNNRDDQTIEWVKGGTYSGNPLHGKGRIEEDGKTFGVWGEILLPKTGGNVGEYTRTGIFLSANGIDNENAKPIELGEGKKPIVFERADQ